MNRGNAQGRRLRGPATFVAVIAVAFGLLLWARLILVTGHPRTATAAPGAKATLHADQPDVPAPIDGKGEALAGGTENGRADGGEHESAASGADGVLPR